MADPAQELPDLPPRLDQAILDPLLTRDQLQALCDSGMQEGVRAICTTPRQLPLLRERIGTTDAGPRLVAAIGFPFGAIPAELKLAEAEWCAAHGAQELDVVPDFSALAMAIQAPVPRKSLPSASWGFLCGRFWTWPVWRANSWNWPWRPPLMLALRDCRPATALARPAMPIRSLR